ncbi:MAG: type II toxin-antitoxin system HipA family toxin [Pseudomonadota bacterium]
MGIDFKSLPQRIEQIQVATPEGAAGTLQHSANYRFSYNESAEQVALAMPVRTEPYNRGALHPVFEMNLPEGFIRRELSERLQRYTRINDMLFLAIQGDEGIGRLSYMSDIDRTPTTPDDLDEIINWDRPDNIFIELLDRHLFNTTLSGMQPKVAVSTEKALLQGKNLIIKSAGDDYPNLALNEFVCMRIAAAAGLPTPVFQLSRNRQLFIMERFDVLDEHKLGMEDFTVLMGRSGQERYLGSYENAARVIDVYGGSHGDLRRFFEYVALSCMLGNGDAHLKNFALLYTHPGATPRLSPIYDVVCTRIYELEAKTLALKMNGSREFPDRRGLLRFAKSLGVKGAESRMEEMADLALQTITATAELEDFPKLKQTLRASISRAMAVDGSQAGFVRKRKDAKKRKADSLREP